MNSDKVLDGDKVGPGSTEEAEREAERALEREARVFVPDWEVVNVWHTADQEGKLLKEEDLVVMDHLVFAWEEMQNFRCKSTMRCPSHGCCPTCWAAGLVAKSCAVCNPPAAECSVRTRCVCASELAWESGEVVVWAEAGEIVWDTRGSAVDGASGAVDCCA